MRAAALRALLWILTRALPESDTECPVCGPTEAHDDVVSPHDCTGADR